MVREENGVAVASDVFEIESGRVWGTENDGDYSNSKVFIKVMVLKGTFGVCQY